MGKYDPLSDHLRKSGLSRVAMRFAEIEAVLGFTLPASARRHRAWWSNNPENNVMTRAWVEAGYRTEDVDLALERLVFCRDETARRGFAEDRPQAGFERGRRKEGARKPVDLFGCLRGTVRPIGDVDLTAPADPDWGKADGHVHR